LITGIFFLFQIFARISYIWHKFVLIIAITIENRLIEQFKEKKFFSREELFYFFQQIEPDLKKGTFGWRIHDLKNKNIIKPLKRGIYTISYKPVFKPVLSLELFKLDKKLSDQYHDVKYCIWDTIWLNEFSQHQSFKNIVIIEIEKEFIESLYYHLKDSLLKLDFFLDPDEKTIDFYIAESSRPVVIKKMITRSPTSRIAQNKLNLPVPILEKILVDVFAENKLFYLYQGAELAHIYLYAIKNYTINFTRLFSYAKRREKEKEIKEFMIRHMHHLLRDIIDD
jgi:hypothetical protein